MECPERLFSDQKENDVNSPYFGKFNSMDFGTKIQSRYLDNDNAEVVIDIQGDMETFYTKFFMADIMVLMDKERLLKTIYMDFDKVTYVSSSFIACLLQIITKSKQSDIDIFFLNINQSMHNVMDTMGLAHFVKDIDLKSRKSFTVICKKCKKNITVKVTGDFECPFCRTAMNINKRGVVK
jgi:anti-anti-sigma factor